MERGRGERNKHETEKTVVITVAVRSEFEKRGKDKSCQNKIYNKKKRKETHQREKENKVRSRHKFLEVML